MMPSCDQTGVPGLVALTHFHSSTTSGSAAWMSLRIRLRVFPRQSRSSAILSEMRSAADWSWLVADFFIFLLLFFLGFIGSGGDDAASDAGAGVAGGIGLEVVGFGV